MNLQIQEQRVRFFQELGFESEKTVRVLKFINIGQCRDVLESSIDNIATLRSNVAMFQKVKFSMSRH